MLSKTSQISYGNKASASFWILAKTVFVSDRYFKIKNILQMSLKNNNIKKGFFAKERDYNSNNCKIIPKSFSSS